MRVIAGGWGDSRGLELIVDAADGVGVIVIVSRG